MKRVFALLLAFVMVFSVLPAEALAAGYGNVYGTNLGWEYAQISTNRNGGYDLTNPSGSNHLGSHVHVTFGGTTIAEGSSGVQNGVLESGSTTSINITCDYGYYISAIVLACAHQSNPFQCQTVATDDAYALAQPGSTLTNVTISMGDIYTWAHHQSSVSTYYLMIELEPIPDNVYVGYFSGSAGGTAISAAPVEESGTLSDGATQVNSYKTWKYSTAGSSAPTHTALGISAAAEAEANALGYSFAGWKLEYYTTYTENGNAFSGNMSVGGTNLPEGTNVTLTINAKLTAIWQPMIGIKVVKEWDDSNNQDGTRPDSVTVHVLGDGVHVGNAQTLSESNNWTSDVWLVPQLDENSAEIKYAVEENSVTGYSASYANLGTAQETVTVNGNSVTVNVTTYQITNSHTPETTVVNVQKYWDDDNNRDGVRPSAGVYVQLYKVTTVDGQEVLTAVGSVVELGASQTSTSTAGSWTNQWTGLPKYENGQLITYTVREVDANGNLISGSILNGTYTHNPGTDVAWDENVNLIKLTNHHTPETTTFTVEKIWEDEDDQDGIRPESVTVTLYANGDSTGKTLTLNEENSWKGTFTDILKYYNNGKEITYTVVEESVPTGYREGYEAVIEGNKTTGYLVYNTHTPEKTEVSVSKTWDDNDNQDGKRPTSITVTLYANDEATTQTLTLTAENNWSGTFTDLDKYAGGELIQYSIVEAAIDGYNVDDEGVAQTVTVDAENGTISITNTREPETINLHVKKDWSDNSNNDGKRPYAVVVTLLKNGTPALDEDGDAYTLVLVGNSWEGVWENLPRYENGQRISYSVTETGYYATEEAYNEGTLTEGLPEGYSVTRDYNYSETAKDQYATLTNTYAPETTSLNIQKVWDDDDDRAGMRPASITVTLYADGSPYMINGQPYTITLNADNEWDGDFEGLPKYKSGKLIDYTVVETAIDSARGYKDPEYSFDSASKVWTITNTREVDYVDVVVTKDWDDNDNQDNIRPEDVTVTLYANGIACKLLDSEGNVVLDDDGNPVYYTLPLSESNNWEAKFENLYKYYQGSEIKYTVVETAVNGYTASYEVSVGNDATSIQVTNTHVPETVSVPVTKTWVDNNDQDDKRPDSITVNLLADGVEIAEYELTLSDGWKYTFTDLPKYKVVKDDEGNITEVGKEIVYTVTEDAVADYETKITGDAVNGYTITNTHEVEKTSISARKVWDDSENQDGVRPESITLHLLANGDHTGKTAVVKADKDGNWSYVWTDLDKYSGGKEINYTVYEAAVKATDGTSYAVSYDRVDGVVVITNSRATDKTSYTVQKVWSDSNNQDGIRPYGVAVQLTADGVAYGDPVILSSANNWRHSWTGLEAHASGEEAKDITYSVVELYYVDADGNRIELEDVDYQPGDPEPDEATGSIYIVTNTHDVIKTSVKVTKAWDDADNQDGIRPASATVELYANYVATGKTVTLNADNNWTATFTELDKYYNVGREVVYTVKEVDVPTGYTAVVSGSAADGYKVTNVHEPATTEVTVSKTWNDVDDQDGKRPDSIVVTLLANGEKVQTGVDEDNNPVYYTIELNVSNNWTAKFTDLPVNKAGKEITYSVEEDAIAYYNVENGTAQSVKVTVENGVAKITNVHEVEKTDLNVKKVWDDSGNQDGKRPYAVVITLYRNGKAVTTPEPLILYSGNNWQGSWDNMPVYSNGAEISYSVVETGHFDTEADYDAYVAGDTTKLSEGVPEGYNVKHSYDKSDPSERVATVTNVYAPETIGVDVQKSWNDANNQDGVRPASVTVALQKKVGDEDWVNTGMTAELNPGNEWNVDFVGLPKYRDGQLISYRVVEIGYTDKEGNYYDLTDEEVAKAWAYSFEPSASVDGSATSFILTLTNIHEPELLNGDGTLDVTKKWDDNENQDGIRPYAVELTLYAFGYNSGKTIIVTEQDWDGTFTDLPMYYNGTKVIYTVAETAYFLSAEDLELYQSNKETYADKRKAGVPAGYTSDVAQLVLSEGEYVATVTNIHTPETIDIPVLKVWDDGNDQDGLRPESITVKLYTVVGVDDEGKDILKEVAGVDTVTLNATNNGTAGFTNLPKYENGTEIQYSVVEVSYVHDGVTGTGVAAGYEVKSSEVTASSATIVNKHTPEETAVTATKVWNDNGDQDGKRPDSVTFHLLADGVHMGEAYKKVLSADENGNWSVTSVTWENLPKYANGQIIRYTVYEEPVYFKTNAPEAESDDGIASQSDEAYVATYERDKDDFYHLIVTNTYVPETTMVAVTKVWKDGDDRDGIRSEEITVELHKVTNKDEDGNVTATEKVGELKLSESNVWISAWENLPKYENHGTLIEYVVKESSDPKGYTSVVKQDEFATENFIVTNTHDPATTGVSVTKIWADEDNNDGVRPDGIIVQLRANGSVVEGARVVLNDSNRWTHTWTSVNDEPLYVFAQGEPIKYDVIEVGYVDAEGNEYKGRPDGYSMDADIDKYTVTITNTRATEKTSFTVSKVWEDADNNDGIRPESVEVTLYKGETKVETVVLNEKNNWTYTWENLYVYQAGEKVKYTVEETAVTGYTATYSETASGVVITNTHEMAVWETYITKVWRDNNDKSDLRPDSIKVQLYKNGLICGDPIVLSAKNGWKYEVKLPLYEDGKEIEWTIKEVVVPQWYVASYNQKTLTVTNRIMTDGTAQTGDTSNVWLWVGLLGASGVAVLALMLVSKKKNKNKGKYTK